MNFVKKTVRAALTLALAASVAVPLGLSSSALNYTIDPQRPLFRNPRFHYHSGS